ncbi:MAG: TetR family transcriptional regulator [Mucilaginibacter sp.]|jgi:AcrR family transcriptional regulator|uniref:TetR/AcrR family transcriptional regulator n=1 Tax=Mucilaginibacter sp. TaxID=1882438 RepID=UPI002606F088|nr:TetR/AcrR family transcriptional regulator [Mucilaginibacter sp.]MDB5002731.1 TetR family transcriptional regulator [Mucilaginibacter sp.]
MSTGSDQQDIKREKILEAAYQRFLHYGYSKTTMNEIAGDLSLSKALLYYYFPDKSQLYIAVMRKLAGEYIQDLENKLNTFVNLKEAFVSQIDTQHNFIVKNYNFFDFFRVNEQNLPDTIWEIITEIHQTEMVLLSAAIKTEADKGNIKPVDNPEQIVDLLLDALHGVRVSAVSHKKVMFPQKEHLDEIHTKRLLLLDIFIKGLMY